MSTPFDYAQIYHNIVLRLSLSRENGHKHTEEEHLLYLEGCRYLAAVAKTFRMNQEEYNKSIEDQKDNDNDNEDKRPTGV